MSELREALERFCAELEAYLCEDMQQANEDLRQMLAAHPVEPAPVANRERVAEVLEALDEAAEHIAIPRASSLAAAWLQGRATKLRAGEPS